MKIYGDDDSAPNEGKWSKPDTDRGFGFIPN